MQELLATACESVVAADALSALRCGAFSSSGSVESGGRPESVRRRRTLESEDSSYDSDTENPGDTTSSTRQHEDVSRTVSDTLGAEFAEYVTAGPQYASRLEFAVKLGYTEQQVRCLDAHNLAVSNWRTWTFAGAAGPSSAGPSAGSERAAGRAGAAGRQGANWRLGGTPRRPVLVAG